LSLNISLVSARWAGVGLASIAHMMGVRAAIVTAAANPASMAWIESWAVREARRDMGNLL
jgi:hypothetical protein